MPCTAVEIEVKGKEGCAFKWWWTERHEEINEDLPEDDPNRVRVWYETHEEKAKHSKKFLEAKHTFDLPDAMLAPGNYSIPVQFVLPGKLRSSMAYKSKEKEKQKAKCKYVIKTEIIGLGDDEVMKYKQVLMIREPPVKFREGEAQFEE